MSRFSDDGDYDRESWLFWANVQRSFRSGNGTKALRQLVAAMESLPTQELAFGVLKEEGEERYCAIGAIARHCDALPDHPEWEDYPEALAKSVAKGTGLAWGALYRLEYENDDEVYVIDGTRERGEPRSYGRLPDGSWGYARMETVPNHRLETPAERWTRVHTWAVKELANREGAR